MNFSVNLLDLLPKSSKRIIVRFLTSNFFDNYGLNKWKSNLLKVSTNTNILPRRFALKFSESRVAHRIFYSMYYYPKPINLKFIALSVAVEAIDNNISFDPKHIIQYSIAVRECWMEEINENDILRERLEKKTGKKISEVIPFLEEEQQALLEILKDKTLTRKEFFMLYSTQSLTDTKVKVYLPNEHGYIDWINGPNIEITLNSFKAIDLGFFRIGYDYKFLDNSKFSYAVSISKDKRSEVVEFGDNHIGQPTKNYIWLS